jgi:Sec7-like guanine-nucleotide exchange factor
LASSDAFHLQALEAYINAFDFNQEPIDIALRRLLMELFLPRETQQIDRVMEAFAKRWHAQNPVFASSDTAYILAFSLIMLHTDAFNKHNKNKMSKADYVRNTRIDGVTADFLEYLYDNITHQPFIFVDGNDIHGTKSFDSPSVGFSLGSNKTDCYALMAEVCRSCRT